MPVIHKLLVQPSHDSGLLVAVGDEVGRLLWVEGDPALQRRAEGMMFVPGADWSEATVGTSAPGTALALGRGIQISGAEHYQRSVHAWSCTAVPFHDPDSGALLGVVDITGKASAVAPTRCRSSRRPSLPPRRSSVLSGCSWRPPLPAGRPDGGTPVRRPGRIRRGPGSGRREGRQPVPQQPPASGPRPGVAQHRRQNGGAVRPAQ
ncbi:uncharacterized 47.3 kDa protein in thcA 5'region [Arthrobacter sp. Hiyo4]|nr:uncharacterized 47.3 kDa protein in thcA 5'region [Arthrobacter sp. Hiyo4]